MTGIHPSAIEEAAVGWLLRVQSADADEADWLALEDWLAAAPENRLAFDRAEALWADLDEDAPALRAGLQPARPQPQPRRARRDGRGSRAPSRPWWAAAAAAAAVAVIAVVVTLSAPRPVPWRTYQTAKGENRLLALEDGSRIHLNSGSTISVRLGRKLREVEMAEAEAAFDVAADPSRPFVIRAGDNSVRVVGTEFNVLRHAGQLEVTVRRGVVEVAPSAKPGATPTARLMPGDQLVRRDGQAAVVRRTDPEVAFAWRGGSLIYREAPLSEVVDDLNRYFTTPIRVEALAAGLRFSGVLMIDTEDAVVRRLEAFLPISVQRSANAVVLAPRPSR